MPVETALVVAAKVLPPGYPWKAAIPLLINNDILMFCVLFKNHNCNEKIIFDRRTVDRKPIKPSATCIGEQNKETIICGNVAVHIFLQFENFKPV